MCQSGQAVVAVVGLNGDVHGGNGQRVGAVVVVGQVHVVVAIGILIINLILEARECVAFPFGGGKGHGDVGSGHVVAVAVDGAVACHAAHRHGIVAFALGLDAVERGAVDGVITIAHGIKGNVAPRSAHSEVVAAGDGALVLANKAALVVDRVAGIDEEEAHTILHRAILEDIACQSADSANATAAAAAHRAFEHEVTDCAADVCLVDVNIVAEAQEEARRFVAIDADAADGVATGEVAIAVVDATVEDAAERVSCTRADAVETDAAHVDVGTQAEELAAIVLTLLGHGGQQVQAGRGADDVGMRLATVVAFAPVVSKVDLQHGCCGSVSPIGRHIEGVAVDDLTVHGKEQCLVRGHRLTVAEGNGSAYGIVVGTLIGQRGRCAGADIGAEGKGVDALCTVDVFVDSRANVRGLGSVVAFLCGAVVVVVVD